MGKLIWHQWGNLLGLTSATFSLWATLWSFMYRKFFWDFIGGELTDHGIITQLTWTKFLVKYIVDLPLVQCINLTLSILVIGIEYSFLITTSRVSWIGFIDSLGFRAGLYLICALPSLLVYQSIDAGIFFLITSLVYGISSAKGESIEGVKQEGGKNRVQRV